MKCQDLFAMKNKIKFRMSSAANFARHSKSVKCCNESDLFFYVSFKLSYTSFSNAFIPLVLTNKYIFL